MRLLTEVFMWSAIVGAGSILLGFAVGSLLWFMIKPFLRD